MRQRANNIAEPSCIGSQTGRAAPGEAGRWCRGLPASAGVRGYSYDLGDKIECECVHVCMYA